MVEGVCSQAGEGGRSGKAAGASKRCPRCSIGVQMRCALTGSPPGVWSEVAVVVLAYSSSA